MKKSILFLASLLVFATGCYEDYVKDFDKTGVFVAYQYNYRTFVLDEGEQFKFMVGLGGVMENDRDRKVSLVKAPHLLDGALECMKDANKVSGEYVYNAFSATTIESLTELPDSYYTIDGMDGLTIRKGWHTASIVLKATDQMRNDPKMFGPYYAVAFKIVKADADEIVSGKDYGVVAVKCENRFYGSWSHSCLIEEKNASGEIVSTRYIPYATSDGNAYTLTTVDGNTLTCDKVAGDTREMTLDFDGNDITLSSEDGVSGTGRFNGDKLLQNRKLYLEYSYANESGNTVYVKDTLSFRNRYRDGVNEWQDENPENYK
ncbi:MAG: hypothetical protein E7111_02055 [Bacteroidales bacterium]|nr:hypothetical protein [Bacteroidales bacterium]